MIGKLEEIVLLAANRCGKNALASAINKQITSATPLGTKTPAFGAIYTTINRMVTKGMMEGVQVSDQSQTKKAFTVTDLGNKMLLEALSYSAALGGSEMISNV